MSVVNKLAGLTLLLGLWASFVMAADSAKGKILHDEQCLRCHGSEFYTSEGRRVQSLEKLTRQVDICVSQLGISWFDEEQADVVQYLNDQFYTFP